MWRAEEDSPPPAPPPAAPRPLRTTPEMRRAMEPHLREIGIRVEMARAAHPDGPLTGEDVFPKIPRDAKTWDDLAAMGKPAAAIAQMLAALWAWEAEEAAESGNGFAAG